jgi:hypothetical protein
MQGGNETGMQTAGRWPLLEAWFRMSRNTDPGLSSWKEFNTASNCPTSRASTVPIGNA